MNFLDELERAVSFFDGALVVEGSRNPAWGASQYFKLIDLPDKASPKAWSTKYANLLTNAHQKAARYEQIVASMADAKASALRNRYTLDIYEQTSHLINYPVQLLLALEAYDNAADEPARKSAIELIGVVCNYFATMRSELESVYSQTRFMQTADGYVSDLNQHSHLASLTQNSDWLFLYEKPMVETTLKWLKD